MGNPIFNFFVVGQNAPKKIYNRNVDLLISKLLSKSILNFGKWSNWKYVNTYFRIFSLTTSRSPKLILKAVLKWEGPYFYCKIFWSVLTNNKKVENWISHCSFKSCAEWFRFFFFMPERYFFHQTPCIYILNSRGGRQTSYFDFAHLSEHPSESQIFVFI